MKKFKLMTPKEIEQLPDPEELEVMILIKGKSFKSTVLRQIKEMLAPDWTIIPIKQEESSRKHEAVYWRMEKK